MKNDIDAILDSMYKDGKLNLGKAKENQDAAKDAISATENLGQETMSTLQAQIEQLTRDTQAELSDLETRLKADGLKENSNADVLKKPLDQAMDQAFSKAVEQVNGVVVGQPVFVKALSIAFKRPFVAGVPEDQPLSKTLIIGENGTGKHLALTHFTSELQKNGVLKSGKITYLDLSNYRDANSGKLFIQDLYPALRDEAQVIVIENVEQCHSAVLPFVRSLFIDGKVPLSSRYLQQKNMLVDIGTTLVPNAISELTAQGKYLFMISEQSEKALLDAFGAQFLTACDDVLRTKKLEDSDVSAIAATALASLCDEAKQKFSLTLQVQPDAVTTLAARYMPKEGATSLFTHTKALYRLLTEYMLRSDSPESTVKTGSITGNGRELSISFDNVTLAQPQTTAAAQEAALLEVKAELKSVVGLSEVKDYILSLEENVKVQQLRQEKGLRAEFPSMHMIFSGNPGTGKTTIARIVSRYLKAIGVLTQGQLVEVTRADLVGQYVGHTAPMTRKAIESALGGVLFVDEAYSLFRGRDDSFGLEAIDMLVKGMEDHRENLVVILAGYSKEMKSFLTANSGLKSRFPNHIEFPDYTPQELLDITAHIVKEKGYRLHEDCNEPLFVFYDMMQRTGNPRTNGNGRMARNKVEAAMLNAAKRNMQLPEAQRDLELLTVADFELSPAVPPSAKPPVAEPDPAEGK